MEQSRMTDDTQQYTAYANSAGHSTATVSNSNKSSW